MQPVHLKRVEAFLRKHPTLFATGRSPHRAAVAVTQGILRLLDEAELRAVLAHELSHVRNRDVLVSTVAAVLTGAISMIANIAQWGLIFGGRSGDERGGNPLVMLAMIIVTPIAALLIQMAISRRREYGTDETGAHLSRDPLALASALRKLHTLRKACPLPMDANAATAHLFIVNPLTGGGLMKLFSTHPPLDERIRRLQGMASY
jgi:heat shock protein HtpX